MSNYLYPTDKINTQPRLPFYRKRVFYVANLSVIFLCVLLFLLVSLLKEAPESNVVGRIEYRRSSLCVFLRPDTYVTEPKFGFTRLSAQEFFLEINGSTRGYNSETAYSHGVLSGIKREFSSGNITRLTFSFRNLPDNPEITFVPSPPHFAITFNRQYDDKFIVVVDPGHGGIFPGAVGSGGTREKDITLDIALRLRDMFSGNSEVEIVLTRESDMRVSISERIRIAGFWDADFFMSLHANSAPNRQVNQTEVYYAGRRSYNPANIIRNELQRELGDGSGKVRRRGFAVIRNTRNRAGAVLVEMMYLSNPEGERMLNDNECKIRIVRSLYNSIIGIMNRVNGSDPPNR